MNEQNDKTKLKVGDKFTHPHQDDGEVFTVVKINEAASGYDVTTTRKTTGSKSYFSYDDPNIKIIPSDDKTEKKSYGQIAFDAWYDKRTDMRWPSSAMTENWERAALAVRDAVLAEGKPGWGLLENKEDRMDGDKILNPVTLKWEPWNNQVFLKTQTEFARTAIRRVTLFDDGGAKDREIKGLKAWKTEMLAVESSWDEQAVGKELGLTLGQNIRANILPKIKELKTELANSNTAVCDRQKEVDGLKNAKDRMYRENIRLVGVIYDQAKELSSLKSSQDKPKFKIGDRVDIITPMERDKDLQVVRVSGKNYQLSKHVGTTATWYGEDELELSALKAQPASPWMPIETAPKDERRILGYTDEWRAVYPVKYSPNRPAPHWTSDDGAVQRPTHWTHLPPFPVEGDGFADWWATNRRDDVTFESTKDAAQHGWQAALATKGRHD